MKKLCLLMIIIGLLILVSGCTEQEYNQFVEFINDQERKQQIPVERFNRDVLDSFQSADRGKILELVEPSSRTDFDSVLSLLTNDDIIEIGKEMSTYQEVQSKFEDGPELRRVFRKEYQIGKNKVNLFMVYQYDIQTKKWCLKEF